MVRIVKSYCVNLSVHQVMQLVASSTRPNVEWRPLQIYLIRQALAGSTMQQNGMGMQPLLHHPPPHSTDDTHSGIHLLLLMLLLDNIHENSFLFMYKWRQVETILKHFCGNLSIKGQFLMNRKAPSG
ncbi:uncharacterized protein LOC124350161 [Daphnia pulicaria]|uniref:uncharacterized protein LOC124350161 n=1 Tax=Daphnia pulicaria TaxID=35523 RepID=UPI001EEB5920|nr:uncharacterized protein LOC124350161 [Daphnia pulicaria]